MCVCVIMRLPDYFGIEDSPLIGATRIIVYRRANLPPIFGLYRRSLHGRSQLLRTPGRYPVPCSLFSVVHYLLTSDPTRLAPSRFSERAREMLHKTIDQWLHEYGYSHQNPVNKAIHWVCVPLILWSILALTWLVPVYAPVNLCMIVVGLCLVFYLNLSRPLALGMLVICGLSIWLIQLHQALVPWHLWITALVIFVLAWAGQFVGSPDRRQETEFF